MTRRILGISTILVAGLMASACGGGSVEPGSGSLIEVGIEISDGDPVGGVQEVSVKRGDLVKVTITGESDDRVHIHGYDLFVEVAGSTSFDALIPGVFEVELERSGRLLLKLTVS